MTDVVADTRGGVQPFWLTAVINPPVGTYALVAIEAPDQPLYDMLQHRMCDNGASFVSANEWLSGAWPRARHAAIDVVRGDLVRVYTGSSSLYTGGHMPVSTRWQHSGRARLGLVGLLPPGSMVYDDPPSENLKRMAQLVSAGRLVGARAKVRFNLPVQRPT